MFQSFGIIVVLTLFMVVFLATVYVSYVLAIVLVLVALGYVVFEALGLVKKPSGL